MKTKYTKFLLGLLLFVAIFSVLFSEKESSKESFKSYNITFNKIDGSSSWYRRINFWC